MTQLDVNELLAAARTRTGLSDFGPADFMEGLTVLVNGINEQAQIRDNSWAPLRERFINLLVNRLWFAKDMAAHPEISDEDLGSPTIVVSLPRTGSTKLHRMLGATGDFQALRYWSALKFARIPDAKDGGIAQRIQETRDFEKWMYETSPGILKGHPMHTDEPEEEMFMLECTFRHPAIFGLFDTPAYVQWWMQADMQPTFDYLVSLIKYLQWQMPAQKHKPWLFKDPNHLGKEAQLTERYQQPKFIVTHRDPVKCVPSVTSTVMAMRRLHSDLDNSVAFGAGIAAACAAGMNDHLKWRDCNPDVPILDLGFREIVEDGIGSVKKVYDFLGMPLSNSAIKGVQAWEDNNPKDKHGKASYSAESIGIKDSEIRHAFAPYIERFSPLL